MSERLTQRTEKREPIKVEWEQLLEEALDAPGHMSDIKPLTYIHTNS